MPNDKTAPEVTVPLAGDAADGDLGAGPRPPVAGPPTAKREAVVMSARRPWSIGQSIGLSRGYTFEPGKAIEVTAEDARILCGREWDGRRFRRADG